MSNNNEVTKVNNDIQVKHRSRGRQSKLTPEIIEQITSYIKDGLFIKDTCYLCNISESILYSWLRQGQEDVDSNNDTTLYYQLFQAVKSAEAKLKLDLVQEAHKFAVRRDSWEGIYRQLESRFPRDFNREQSSKNNEHLTTALEVIKRLVDTRNKPELPAADQSQSITVIEAKELTEGNAEAIQ
jgi:hypothetical protein